MEVETIYNSETGINKIFDLYKNDITNQLEKKENSELFKIINGLSKNEFNPLAQKPLSYITFPEFINYLNKESKKFYLNKTSSTMYEYPHNLGTRVDWVHYCSLEAKIETEEDIKLCLRRLGILFAFLVKEGLVLATFGDLFALPLTREDKKNMVCFGLFVALEKYDRKDKEYVFKQYNDLVGFDVFTYSGMSIKDFDWTQLDTLLERL